MRKPVSTLIRLILVLVFCACLLSSQSVTYGQSLGTITVEAGDYKRLDVPVSLDLSGLPGIGFPLEELSLVEIKGSQRLRVPAQFEAGSPPRLWWVLSGTTPAAGTRTYELVKGGVRSRTGVGRRHVARQSLPRVCMRQRFSAITMPLSRHRLARANCITAAPSSIPCGRRPGRC